MGRPRTGKWPRRVRLGPCIYITPSGKFQTWHRDRDDKQIWETFPNLKQAIKARDNHREERQKYVGTNRWNVPFDRTLMGKLAKEIGPPPAPKPRNWLEATAQVIEQDDTPVWEQYDTGPDEWS